MARILEGLEGVLCHMDDVLIYGCTEEKHSQRLRKDTIVSADASAYGLGALLRQQQSDGKLKVTAYASRTLTETERRYAQIEKEALAAVWACEKFRDYLIGTRFTLETDHKPLVTLFSTKSLDDLTPRLQRLQCGDLDEEVQAYIQCVTANLPATAPTLDWIKEQQTADPTCQQLVCLTKHDWPSKRDTPHDLKQFWDHRHQLSISGKILMYGSRIVIPQSTRNTILQMLHQGHFGIVKCQLRARDSVWWPGINADIEQMVKDCNMCAQHRINRKMPLMPTSFPQRPWEKVAMDLFCLNGQWWSIVTDYYSRYPEIARLSSLSAATVVNNYKSIFARHGIPNEVISDNRPQFAGAESSEFRKFAEEFKFKHTTSSPRYPQSNGMAEAAVKIIKGSMKKTGDPYETLLSYRSTLLKNGYSPAELLMGRRLRTTLSTAEEMLLPKKVDHEAVKKCEELLKKRQKQQFDRHYRRSTSL
ncbi:uncharacterized protein K02A2.6-like [Ornithodoros turicata]|uniref:uncharacterized protein K02A2.6-like n=1 Tax=Ornithodoros turicata TaxID=34597 RepID=UPI0031396AE7